MKKDIISKILNTNWFDSELMMVTILFDRIEFKIKSGVNERIQTIQCYDYIGYENIGHWDEAIIERVSVIKKSNFIELNMEKILY